jgi:hypothetical protein
VAALKWSTTLCYFPNDQLFNGLFSLKRENGKFFSIPTQSADKNGKTPEKSGVL